MAKPYSDKERQEYCTKWYNGTLGKTKFCKNENISESALHRWLKSFKIPKQSSGQKKSDSDIKFIAPELTAATLENKAIEILLPNGITIKTEAKSIANIVRELLL